MSPLLRSPLFRLPLFRTPLFGGNASGAQPTPRAEVSFVRLIAEEIARIVEMLRTPLSLRSVIISRMHLLPSPGVANLVNGVWIIPAPDTNIDPGALPRILNQRYLYRLVYIRRIGPAENVVRKTMDDAAVIVNTLTDKVHLPDITTLPASAQVLWMLTRNIEWNPSEDNLVQSISADLSAVAFTVEVQVRCRRSS